MTSSLDVISYIFNALNCAHPFRASRILLLAEWRAEERLGHRLTDLTYVKESFGFYMEGLAEVIEYLQNRGCLEKVEEEKCLRYLCGSLELPPDVASLLEEIIAETKGMSDRELNKLVIEDPRYGR